MRLYHVPNSSSQRVLWLLEEIGEPYDLTVLGDRASRLDDPEHMARHPMGRVPVVENDGEFIFESAAICLQIADSYPSAGLIPPPGTQERGLVYQWSLFAITEIQAKMIQSRMSRESDPQGSETAKESLLEAAVVLEKALDGHDYLVGNRFTVADILVSATLAGVRRLDVAELPPGLNAYLDAMDARPAKHRAEALDT
jgi:glutathione S-transferase